MSIKVIFFASAREITGTREITLDLTEQLSTSTDVLKHVCGLYPQLTPGINQISIAVNQVYIKSSTILKDRDIVAFLPPISGG
jgi:molybdopterin synthase catalytic subunit